MARGNITEYQQGAFSKQAVGTPGMDQSGAIIGQGIEALGDAVAKYEEKSNTLSAQSKFNDFRFEYENTKRTLQEEYRNDPRKFPEAMGTAKQAIVDKYSKEMSGGELKKFKQYEMNFAGQEIEGIAGWVFGRDLEINVDRVKGNFHEVQYLAESTATPEELKALLGDPNNIVEGEQSVAAAKKMASEFLDPGAIMQLGDQAEKATIDNHLSSRIRVDAARAYDDLQQGKYDRIIRNKNLIARYTTEARTAMINNAVVDQYRRLATASAEIAQNHDMLVEGKITVGDINRKIQWAELHKADLDVNKDKIISDNYLRGLYANRDIALGLRPATKEKLNEASRVAVEKWEGRWFNYLAGRKRKAKASPADYDDVIGLYADLEEMNAAGLINPEAYEDKRKLMDNKLKHELNPKGVSASLSQALEKAGNYHFWDNPRDVYATGYEMIDKHLTEHRPDLSTEEKRAYRDQYLLAYTRLVNALPEEQRNVKNREQFAIDALYGNAQKNVTGIFDQLGVYKHPETNAPLMFGQKTRISGQEVQFVGVNPKTGGYRFATSDEFKKNVGK
jgi:hypothetical protein